MTRGYGFANLACAQLGLGNTRRAADLAEAAIDIAEELGEPNLEVQARLYQAMCHLRMAEAPRVERAVSALLDGELPVSNDQHAQALTIRAQARLDNREAAAALADIERAELLRDDLGSMPEGELELFSVLERALRANGRHADADRAAWRREERVDAVASRISDESARARYLLAAQRLTLLTGAVGSDSSAMDD
jgi:hypothetical protein